MGKSSVAPKHAEKGIPALTLGDITITRADPGKNCEASRFKLSGEDLAHVVAVIERLGSARLPNDADDVNLMLRGLAQILGGSEVRGSEADFFLHRILGYFAAVSEVGQQRTDLLRYRVTITPAAEKRVA